MNRSEGNAILMWPHLYSGIYSAVSISKREKSHRRMQNGSKRWKAGIRCQLTFKSTGVWMLSQSYQVLWLMVSSLLNRHKGEMGGSQARKTQMDWVVEKESQGFFLCFKVSLKVKLMRGRSSSLRNVCISHLCLECQRWSLRSTRHVASLRLCHAVCKCLS